jgi:hypothetical protein
MAEEMATPRRCAVKDLSLGDRIEAKDFGEPLVVRKARRISDDVFEVALENDDGEIQLAQFKPNEEVTVVAKNVKKAAKGKTKNAAIPATAKSNAKTAPKPAAPAKAKKASGAKMSAIDAAAKVLGEAAEPMNCQEMIAAMGQKGYWTSPGGKTPAATLYSAILRQIQTQGEDARFKKAERGKFTLTN